MCDCNQFIREVIFLCFYSRQKGDVLIFLFALQSLQMAFMLFFISKMIFNVNAQYHNSTKIT